MLKKLKIRLVILIIVTTILQVTLIPYISLHNVKPDLFYGLFALLILQFSNIQTILLAFIIGFLKDLFANNLFGLEIISLLIPALILPFIVKKTDINNPLVRFIILFISSLLAFFTLLTSIAVIEKSPEVINIYFMKILESSLYTAIISFVLYYFLKLFIPKKTEQYELF